VAFEQLCGDSLDTHLERLAHYYSRSDELPKALHYLERAGDKALELQTVGQAREFWRRAGKVAARLGDQEAEHRLSERLRELAS
jgi:hypothetical protein